MPTKSYDLAIIGAGSAGLTMAAVSAGLGYKVVLFEKDKMGGDCLNSGCVPSKAFLAAGKGNLTFPKTMKHIKHAIKTIEPHDSEERFRGLGVDVVKEQAVFTSPTTLQAGDMFYTAKRIIIATGAHAFIPPIQGLNNTPYLTNENIFHLKEKPKHLIIIGGGPIGCEMAEAFINQGAEVTLIEGADRLLIRDDKEASAVIHNSLKQKGVKILTHAQVQNTSSTNKAVTVQTSKENISGSHLLIAVGRQANVKNLGLENAGVDFTPQGITVNNKLQTTQKHIYAIGDCASAYQFTHMASLQASYLIKKLLFGTFWATFKLPPFPHVTYTSPELAQVGLTEKDVKQKKVKITRVNFTENDRAITEGKTEGFIKVITTPKGKILGVTIVGIYAGELIHNWVYMMTHGHKISKLAAVTVSYPTLQEINKKVVSEFYKEAFYAPRTGKISRFLFRLFG